MMNNGMNPMQLAQQLRQAANPQQILIQVAQNNPSIRRAMQMINGRSPDQILDMARQLAQQHGQNINQLAQQLGVKLPR